MRVAAAFVVAGLLGVLAASALTHATRAASPKLIAAVNDDATITLKDASGNAISSLSAGTHDIEVHDNSADHNFDLIGPGGTSVAKTSVAETGVFTWTVTLTAGTWKYQCDPHFSVMNGSFTVTAPATTTGAGTTTAPATTATAPPPAGTTTTAGTVASTTTTTPAATNPGVITVARPRRCVVPRVLRLTLTVANKRITRAGCRTGRIARAYSSAVKRGRVAAQKPRAGSRVARGTRVNLVVSRGPRR